MKDCTTCKLRPQPGGRYEETACCTCTLDEPQAEKGRVSWHSGFDEPSPGTWKLQPEPAITEASTPACGLALYLRMSQGERRAIRRFCTVISLSTENYIADKAEHPFANDSDVARKQGTSRQAACKKMKRIRKEITEWEDYEREARKHAI